MKRFEYQAHDAHGSPVQGITAAVDAESAVSALVARGFTGVELREIDMARLSASEAAELASYLVELAKAGLPLSGRLRALAEDASTPALQSAYREISAELEAGRSLEQILDTLGASLPEHYRRTLGAALARGDMPQTLDRLLVHQQRVDEMSRQFRQAITYPLLLAAMLLAWIVFISWDVLPALGDSSTDGLLSDYEVDSEGLTQWQILDLVSTWLPRILLGTVLGSIAIVLLLALTGGRAAVSWLLGAIPLLGPCWKNRGLTDFCGLLGEFIRQQLPLDEALRLTSSACRDPLLGDAATMAREEIVRGKSLVRALHVQQVFPATVAQWVQWGETHGALPEALDAAGELAAKRFGLRLQLLQAVLPAVVFVLVALSAVMLMAAISHVLLSLVSLVTWNEFSGDSSEFETRILAVLGSLAVLGIGLVAWFTARFIDTSEADLAERIVRIFGIVFMTLGLFAVAFTLGSYPGILVAFILVAAAIQAARRYREIGKQSLWAAMTIAAEHNAPLAPMALAVADEQGGRGAHNARRLAEQLSAGVDLADSVAWTSGALPGVAPMAVRVGTDSDDLRGAFNAAGVTRDASRPLLSPSVAWLVFFLPVAFVLVAFAQLMIMPSFVTIFEDFDTQLPNSTIAVISVLNSGLLPWGLMLLGACLLFVWLQWRGIPRPMLPGLSTTVRLLEVGPLLRLLALPVRHGKPLVSSIDSMARLHPRGWIRRRLDRVLRDLQRGASWQEGLRNRGLVAQGDLALLSAAERNGNLAWALEELGTSYQRRAEYRLRLFTEFAFPLLVLTVGLLVAAFALAYFTPLADLIQNLN